MKEITKTIKQKATELEAGRQLTIIIRYGNEYTNDGQFHHAMTIVKSKGKLRNPERTGKLSYWTYKEILNQIEWYKNKTHFYHIKLDMETENGWEETILT